MFSTIIPFYGSLDLLERSVASVFRQTLPSDEVIIVDNNPNCDLKDRWFASNSPYLAKVKIIDFGDIQNAALARNQGISCAKKGNFIALLDSGDVWHENHLSQALQVMNQHPDQETILYFTAYLNWNPKTGRSVIRQPRAIHHIFDLFKLNPICTSSVILKGGAQARFPAVRMRHDLALWADLLSKKYMLLCQQDLHVLRIISPSSLSSGLFKKIYYQYIVTRKYPGVNLFRMAQFFCFQALAKLSQSRDTTDRRAMIEEQFAISHAALASPAQLSEPSDG
jgi:glycosyltransferase involved in cell wall biosynthesis